MSVPSAFAQLTSLAPVVVITTALLNSGEGMSSEEDGDLDQDSMPRHTLGTSALHKLTFLPAVPLVRRGAKGPVEHQDMWRLRESVSAEKCWNDFNVHWRKESRRTHPSLGSALFSAFGGQFFVAVLLMALSYATQFALPILMPHIIKWFTYNTMLPLWWIYVYTVAIVVATCGGTLLFYHSQMIGWEVGLRVRNVLVTLLYRKSLTVANTSSGSAASIHNLVAGDATVLLETFNFFVMSVLAPLQIAVVIGLLGIHIKYYCLIPIGVAILITPLSSFLSKNVSTTIDKHQQAADTRVKFAKEFFSAIRIIKYYAWEVPFLENIKKLRSAELIRMRAYFLVRAFLTVSGQSIPSIGTGLTFFIYGLFNTLTLTVTFSAFTYLSMLRWPFNVMPNIVILGESYRVAFQRIQRFILSADIQGKVTHLKGGKKNTVALRITGGNFAWETSQSIAESKFADLESKTADLKDTIRASKDPAEVKAARQELPATVQARDETALYVSRLRKAIRREQKRLRTDGSSGNETLDDEEFLSGISPSATFPEELMPPAPTHPLAQLHEPSIVLKDITLSIKKGSVSMIVGPVGCGKSTLGSAFCGEVNVLSGTVEVAGKIAYAPQEPCIFKGTLRENIVFGAAFDVSWYMEVVTACSLLPDIVSFPAHDMTEIGERGINLSGGQRARIGVARAMYSKRPIVILDDPFSAVDAHVADSMFKQVVHGLKWAGSTVVLITNQLHWLNEADSICVLRKGAIVEQGTFDELVTHGPESGTLANLLKSQTASDNIEVNLTAPLAGEMEDPITQPTNGRKRTLVSSDASELIITPEKDAANKKLGKLTQDEERESGTIGLKTYGSYISAGGWLLFSFVTISQMIRIASRVVSGLWLSWWSTSKFSFTKPQYLGGYLGIVGGEIFFHLVVQVMIVFWGVNASRSLHQRMMTSVARARISWFDATPLGRILTRFTSDIWYIDIQLPVQIDLNLNTIFTLLGIMASLASGSVWVLIVMGLALFAFAAITLHFRKASIEMQRLEVLSHAPIHMSVSESLLGASVIRSFNRTEEFKLGNMAKLNYSTVDYFGMKYCAMWFALTLGMLGNVIVGLTFVALILVRTYSPTSIALSYMVYALSSSGGFTYALSMVVTALTDVENQMTTVERALEYAKHIPYEAPAYIPMNSPPASWPSRGEITFENVVAEYVPGVPILKGLSCSIKAGEKVGVVGRTGAGKSTLATALFRTIELSAGRIIIDGVDIAIIGLADLRSKLSIIPQVPQLFVGTVRYNLDPFQQCTDNDIWMALERVKLKEHVSSMPGQLGALVEEGGANFSVGQRQLLAMARCLLRDTHILILDEATAAIDVETDALIQSMLRKHFKTRSVITIAHRLNTVMDCNRIMVLDAGKIVEFDSPKHLLKNTKGVLYGMVEATGPQNRAYLHSIANGQQRVVDPSMSQVRPGEKRLETFGRLYSRRRLGTIENSNAEAHWKNAQTPNIFEHDTPPQSKPSSPTVQPKKRTKLRKSPGATTQGGSK